RLRHGIEADARRSNAIFRIVALSTFSPEDEDVVRREIHCIKTQGVACSGQTPFQVRPSPVHHRHEVIAYDFDARLRDRGQSVFPRTYETLVGSGSKLDRIVDGNTFRHRPGEARRKNLISTLEHLVQRPCFSAIKMVQRGDDPRSSRLLDVIERNRIPRPKPPPSLLHVFDVTRMLPFVSNLAAIP